MSFVIKKRNIAVARSGAMEAETISKNGLFRKTIGVEKILILNVMGKCAVCKKECSAVCDVEGKKFYACSSSCRDTQALKIRNRKKK